MAEILDPMRVAKCQDFIDALAAAAADYADDEDDDGSPESGGDELPEDITPENGPVLMSEGMPLCGHRLKPVRRTRSEVREQTKKAVDSFFEMLPGNRGK